MTENLFGVDNETRLLEHLNKAKELINDQAAEIERLRELVADAKTIITMTDFTSSAMDDLEHLWLQKEAASS